MREIRNDVKEKPFSSNILKMYFHGKKTAVLDIETTGLSAARNEVILVGLVYLSSDEKQVLQIFADHRADEAELLRRTVRALESCDVIVTYNGASFDVPFLRKRMELLGVPGIEIFDSIYHVDMLKILRRYSEFKSLLPDLKQKTVEEYLGLSDNRKDEISGAESVRMYNRYCSLTKKIHFDSVAAADTNTAQTEQTAQAESGAAQTGFPLSPEAQDVLSKILLHNRDDILRLSEILSVTRQLDVHKIMYMEGWPGVRRIMFEPGFVKIEGDMPLRIPVEIISGYNVADLVELDSDTEEMKNLPGYESGYLILSSKNNINYIETNSLIISIMRSVKKDD